jgi:hypothetical protein
MLTRKEIDQIIMYLPVQTQTHVTAYLDDQERVISDLHKESRDNYRIIGNLLMENVQLKKRKKQ